MLRVAAAADGVCLRSGRTRTRRVCPCFWATQGSQRGIPPRAARSAGRAPVMPALPGFPGTPVLPESMPSGSGGGLSQRRRRGSRRAAEIAEGRAEGTSLAMARHGGRIACATHFDDVGGPCVATQSPRAAPRSSANSEALRETDSPGRGAEAGPRSDAHRSREERPLAARGKSPLDT